MSESLLFSGRAWCFGADVDTDQILPGYAMAYPREQWQNYAMAGSAIPDFPRLVQNGDIIVGGRNFGAGSSREQAPVALKDAGVSAVVATSFARIFRRNAINIGLPVIIADLLGKVQNGDEIVVDVNNGRVQLADDGLVDGQTPGENVRAILAAGGLIAKVRQQLAMQRKEVE